jgi:ankyrin repeat protein
MNQFGKICFLITFFLSHPSKASHSPLFQAILADNEAKAKELATKEDINEENYLGLTALYIAAMKGNYNLVKHFISLESDSFVQNNRSLETALHQAVYSKSYDCVRILLESSAPIGVKDKHGYDSLDIAYKVDDKKIIQLLEEWSEEKVKRIPIHVLLGNFAWAGYWEKIKPYKENLTKNKS